MRRGEARQGAALTCNQLTFHQLHTVFVRLHLGHAGRTLHDTGTQDGHPISWGGVRLRLEQAIALCRKAKKSMPVSAKIVQEP